MSNPNIKLLKCMSEKVEPEELKEAARGAYRQLQDELETDLTNSFRRRTCN